MKGLLTRTALATAVLVFLTSQSGAADYTQWTNGPSSDPSYFPIAVWLQNPNNAERYKTAGINLYVAISGGAKSNQLALLAQAGMKAICIQNATTLEQRGNPVIIGWMHGDEPDNAQSLGRGKGYGPPILPATIASNYANMHAADPSRPVLLNLGQGVAWDNYIGRGVRRNHPEDYPEYIKGCDMASFDIYPVVHDHQDIAGKLEFVARGVARLCQWSGAEKPVWNCIECTRISNTAVKPTPEQVRSEVWMSLIHGSQGIIYFVHQFRPTFREAALLDDPEMVSAVTAINRQIHELAPVLNSTTLKNVVISETSAKDVPVSTLVKWHENQLYVFTVCMRNASTRCTLKFRGVSPTMPVEVMGEARSVAVESGKFTDDFKPYEVHLYRMGWESVPQEK
jgi:hypothetical protein